MVLVASWEISKVNVTTERYLCSSLQLWDWQIYLCRSPSVAMEASEVPASPPTEMVTMSEENGSAAEAHEVHEAPEAPVDPHPENFSMPTAAEDEEGELPADFERLWKAAHDSPQDFTSWTDLLQYCEQEVCGVCGDFWLLSPPWGHNTCRSGGCRVYNISLLSSESCHSVPQSARGLPRPLPAVLRLLEEICRSGAPRRVQRQSRGGKTGGKVAMNWICIKEVFFHRFSWAYDHVCGVLCQVCIQGLQVIPLSVDLWIHYINLLLGTLDMNLPESPVRIRR